MGFFFFNRRSEAEDSNPASPIFRGLGNLLRSEVARGNCGAGSRGSSRGIHKVLMENYKAIEKAISD
jgi:hypothetical protein